MRKLSVLEITLTMCTAAFLVYPQIILRNRGMSMTMVGVVLAFGQIATIIGPLLMGSLVQKTGKDGKVLFLCIIASTILYLPVTIGKNQTLAILSFILMFAFMYSCNPILDGYLNKYLQGDSAKYGKIRSLGTLAYVVILAVITLVGFPDETNNAQIMVLIAATGILFATSAFNAPQLQLETPEVKTKTKPMSFGNFSKKFYLVMLIVGITKIASVVIEKYLSTYMTEELKLGNSFAMFTALGSLFEFFAMLISAHLLEKKKITYYHLILASIIGYIIRFLIYRLTSSLVPFIIGQTLHFFTYGTFHPGVMSFIAENTNKEQYSQATTFYWALVVNLPQTIGSLVGGVVIDNWGYKILFSSFMIFPIISLIIALIKRKELQTA